MALKDEVTKFVTDTFHKAWDISEEDHVPTDDDAIGLGNVGVEIDAVVLYADLADSTGLVSSNTSQFAAEIYKTYVYAATKAIRAHQGSVTAYDGDRVMGVFVTGDKCNNVVEAAFHLCGIVEEVIQPELDAMYGAGRYEVNQKVGIDQSKLLVANTGIRGNNDYVWVGTSANNAAKMAALKKGYSTYVTFPVYGALFDYNLKAASDDHDLWATLGKSDLGYSIYGANARKVHI